MVCALHMVPIEWGKQSLNVQCALHIVPVEASQVDEPAIHGSHIPWKEKRQRCNVSRSCMYQFPHGSPASIHVNPGSCWQPQEISSVFMWHPTAFTATHQSTRHNVESQGNSIYQIQCSCHIWGNEKQTSKQFRLLDKQCNVSCLSFFVTPFFKHI